MKNRRNFIKNAIASTAGLVSVPLVGCAIETSQKEAPFNEDLYFIGPRPSYSPQMGTLVSMMNYMRDSLVNTVKDLTMAQLDHLQDENANSIGSLILHLGATDKFYQINTFEERQEFNEEEKLQWGAAQSLGDQGRAEIKGQEVQYYLDRIAEVRAETLEIFKTKNDEWLMNIDPEWSNEESDLNTYWKWFHVCEHESNHRGQIKWLKDRLPA